MPSNTQTSHASRALGRWVLIGVLTVACLILPQPVVSASEAAPIDWGQAADFWSFKRPVAEPPPQVQNERWPQRILDRYVLARLESKGFAPSPRADKRTLLRRIALDLTGLPPSPEDLVSFLADTRPDAYEQRVEQLLASPSFGERLASLWLPLARYAEDQAHQVGDDTKYFYPNAYHYRDWVIGAFNQDLPYDRFIRLQIAADKLEGTNSPNLAALGFLGLGPKYYDRERLAVQADEWEDRVDTVARAVLGLTVACARCHDHKFEPITMEDYYAFAGVFANTRMVNRKPGGVVEKSDLQATNFSPAVLHVVEDSEKIQNIPVFLRGNVDRKGPLVERRFLQILSGGKPRPFQEGSGRRELAVALSSSDNPLTARVFVNRMFASFLGRPLVSTPSNFGRSGQAASDPRLLDALAVRFMERGWSIKELVREVVLSATYQQASRGEHPAAGIDPANEWLWRMNRRRLSIEQWRDSILFLTGSLQRGGGRSLELDDPANCRRTVHARISRLKLNDLLMQFDYPDANVHAERRSVTTTALQKLFVLNSSFMLQQAQALATRIQQQRPRGAEGLVRRAYEMLYARAPRPQEMRLGEDFLNASPDQTPADVRLQQYCQVLLASNEAFYVD